MLEDRESLTPPVEPAFDPPPPVLQTEINVRSTSLAVLALIAVIGLLYFARAVFIPITIAVLASYALTPIVDWLKKRAGLPKAVGAGVTLTVILVGLGVGVESLQPQAIQVLDIVPRATQKFSAALRLSALGPPGAVEKMQTAAREIEKAAHAAATPSNPAVTAAATSARAPTDPSYFQHLGLRSHGNCERRCGNRPVGRGRGACVLPAHRRRQLSTDADAHQWRYVVQKEGDAADP